VRWYGSSVSDPAIVRAMAEGRHMVASQLELNVVRGELETLSVAEDLGLASLNRTPLAKRLLGGRYRPDALPHGRVRQTAPRSTPRDASDALHRIDVGDRRHAAGDSVRIARESTEQTACDVVATGPGATLSLAPVPYDAL
jgi:aryl-alcohol dehydrogenase-like predicted oxidoreductase